VRTLVAFHRVRRARRAADSGGLRRIGNSTA
jgi:hypothetical protein